MKRAARLGALVAALAVTGCSVAGQAAPARYTPVGPTGVHALALPGVAGALAFAPDGGSVATTAGGRVCVVRVADPDHPVCTPTTTASPSVAFSPDGRFLAIGVGLDSAGPGSVSLFDPAVGTTTAVPGIAGVVARSGDAAETPFRSGAAYTSMAWNTATGHLVLINLLRSDTVSVARVVDLDPGPMLLRPTGDLGLTGQGFSGYLAVGGTTVAGGVYLSQQLPADLVLSDLDSGVRTDLGVVADAGHVWPLAVAPDGGQVLVGQRTGGAAGPPILLARSGTSRRTLSPAVGDVALAAFSPDGRWLVTLGADSGGRVRLALTSVADPADTTLLDSATGPLDPHATLTWDSAGVVAVTGSSIASAQAWHLSL